MPKEITFLCPKCAGTTIEEIQVDVVVATEFNSIFEHEAGGVDIIYGEQTNDGGYVERYQCNSCGYTIDSDVDGNGTNEDNLIEALKELANVG